VDIRVGRIAGARLHPTARKPSIILELDFGGAIGRKTSSAQLTVHYTPEQLIGRQVVAVVNFPPSASPMSPARCWSSACPTRTEPSSCCNRTWQCRSEGRCSRR
jgi:hypothetical protein